MSLHVYLEGLGGYLCYGRKRRLEMPCQWLMAACKAFGNETVQISIAPHFLEIIQNAQRDLTHPERTTGLISEAYSDSSPPHPLCFSPESSEVSEPAHLGSDGYWCLPGRYQEIDPSVYCKITHYINKHIQTISLFIHNIIFGYSGSSEHRNFPLCFIFPCSLDQMATTLPLTPMDMCCSTPISNHW